MSSNAELITQVSRAAKDPTNAQRTRAIVASMITDAMDYIIDKTECLRKIDSTSVVLVAGTQEYSMPNSFIKFPVEINDVPRGIVVLGTNGNVEVEPTTTALLNSREIGWREAAAGIPRFYYLIKSGTPKIGFYPKPSSSYISSKGTGVFMDIIYRPSDIDDSASLPFDGSLALRGAQFCLKMRTLWQIKMEDLQFADADRLKNIVYEELERIKDLVESMTAAPGQHGFVTNFQGDV